MSDNPERLVPNHQEYPSQTRDLTVGSHSPEVQVPVGCLIDDGPSATTPSLWQRLLQISRSSTQSGLVVGDCAPRPIPTSYQITISTPEMRHRQIEAQAKHVHLKVSKVQLGVWYRQTGALPGYSPNLHRV